MIIFAALVVALASAGCSGSSVFGKRIKGSGVLQTRSAGVEAFHTVEASRSVRVVIAGPDDSLTIRADDNVLDYVVTEVRGGVLRLSIDERINSLHNVQVEVTVPDNGGIRMLKASSAASIVGGQPLSQVDKLQISASSAANVRVAARAGECRIKASSSATVETMLEAESCEVQASSAARVRLNGSCERCTLRASSAARIDGGDFTAQTCAARASSAGTISVRCEKSLRARTSSAGSICYAGEPKADLSSGSGGSITKM